MSARRAVTQEQGSRAPGGAFGRTVAYGLVLGGHLRSVKIGRRRLVVRASIEEYIARLESVGR